MDNKTGIAVLSSILSRMDYPNDILSKGDDISMGIDVKDLHSLLLKGCQNLEPIQYLEETGSTENILIFVKTVTGKTWRFKIHPSSSVKRLKEKIMDDHGIRLDQQRMIYAGFQLEDRMLLHQHGVHDRSTIHMILRLRGGGPGILLSPTLLLDERFHFDFTKIDDKGKSYYRGGVIYIRPCGWQRYALKVDGKYQDDTWLVGKGKRPDQFSSSNEEWPVSYHGTSYNNGLSIAEEGYRLSLCKRFRHGVGIYSTPEIEIAFKYAETRTQTDGKTFKVVIQNRVNPKNLIKIDKAETKVAEYWISPSEEDIRPYGFCLKELEVSKK